MRLTIFLSITLILPACGGTAEKASNTGNAPANTASTANSSQPATVAGDQQVADVNASDTNNALPDQLANKRKIVDVPTSGPPPPPQFRPAGEDTEIAVSMRADGKILEIRRFKRHPQFAKIESVWDGKNAKELKFYLRGGRVIEKTSDRFENLQTAPVSVLVDIAGLTPPPPAGSTSTDKKRP